MYLRFCATTKYIWLAIFPFSYYTHRTVHDVFLLPFLLFFVDGKTSPESGKLCFHCGKVRFNLFHWAYSCAVCARQVSTLHSDFILIFNAFFFFCKMMSLSLLVPVLRKFKTDSNRRCLKCTGSKGSSSTGSREGASEYRTCSRRYSINKYFNTFFFMIVYYLFFFFCAVFLFASTSAFVLKNSQRNFSK
jgi:hypothetical protein